MSAARALRWLAAAAVVGVVLGLLKGDGHPLRTAIGNLSAPWLLVALVPAWWSGSWWRGALLGTAATLAGLLGFYVAVTVVLHGHLGGAEGWGDELVYVVSANRLWFGAGLLSGPVMGAVGGLLGPGRRRLVVVSGLLLVGELAVVSLVAGVRVPLVGVSWAVETWTAYVVQAVAGVVLLLAASADARLHPAR